MQIWTAFVQKPYSQILHLKTTYNEWAAWKDTRGYLELQSFGGILCLFYFLAALHELSLHKKRAHSKSLGLSCSSTEPAAKFG